MPPDTDRGRPCQETAPGSSATTITAEDTADLPAAAAAYAAAGWQVFPLSRTKAPLFPSPHNPGHGCRGECGQPGHGFHDAANDPATIADWWARHPNANIGGRVNRDVMVLDVDPHGGGADTIARLEAEHGALPVTLTCYSGRGDGGRHLYFERPATPGWRVTRVKLRPGVVLIHHTLRYTVLPPSVHPKSGRPYWWDNPTAEPAAMPSWLARLVTPSPPPAPSTRPVARAPGSVAGLVSFVLRQRPGGRHDAVLWALSRAYEEVAPDIVIDAICRAAERIGKPPAEVERMKAWAQAEAGVGGGA